MDNRRIARFRRVMTHAFPVYGVDAAPIVREAAGVLAEAELAALAKAVAGGTANTADTGRLVDRLLEVAVRVEATAARSVQSKGFEVAPFLGVRIDDRRLDVLDADAAPAETGFDDTTKAGVLELVGAVSDLALQEIAFAAAPQSGDATAAPGDLSAPAFAAIGALMVKHERLLKAFRLGAMGPAEHSSLTPRQRDAATWTIVDDCDVALRLFQAGLESGGRSAGKICYTGDIQGLLASPKFSKRARDGREGGLSVEDAVAREQDPRHRATKKHDDAWRAGALNTGNPTFALPPLPIVPIPLPGAPKPLVPRTPPAANAVARAVASHVERVRAEVSRLPHVSEGRLRRAIELALFRGWDQQRIAARLGCALGTVNGLLATGLARLAAALGPSARGLRPTESFGLGSASHWRRAAYEALVVVAAGAPADRREIGDLRVLLKMLRLRTLSERDQAILAAWLERGSGLEGMNEEQRARYAMHLGRLSNWIDDVFAGGEDRSENRV